MHVRTLFVYMGAPEGPGEVRDYVYRFLWDVREHIGLAGPNADAVISRIADAEARRVAPRYEAVGGSPVVRNLRELVEQAASIAGVEPVIGMCYSRPLLEDLELEGRFGVFPLYPVYSAATTERCLLRVRELWGDRPYVREWWRNRRFIEWVRRSVYRAVGESGFSKPHVVLTVHSIPARLVEEGDPYLDSYRALVREALAGAPWGYTLAFQSVHGKRGWLGPSVPEVLRALAESGAEEVVVYPVGFITENVETLYELDVEYRGVAEELGLRYYRGRIDHRDPLLVEAVAEEAGRLAEKVFRPGG